MRPLPCLLALVLLALPLTFVAAQEVERVPILTGVHEYLAGLDYPESLSLKLSGIFRSTDFETYAQVTIDPFADLSQLQQWMLIRGERYDYELSLVADEWLLRSLALSVLGQAAARSTTAAPAPQMTLTGSFIARHDGMILPDYRAEGDAERDVIIRIASLPMPNPIGFNPVETDDARLKMARLDVLDFVSDCHRLGGQAVLEVTAPAGSTVQIWTIGHPAESALLPVGEKIGTRNLPSAPWNLRIELPEGMTVADLPDGRVNLQIDADGVLPDWLE